MFELLNGAYFRKALALGTWLILPMKGIVGGPGGKLSGRRLAKKYLDKMAIIEATERLSRPKIESLVVLTRSILPEQNHIITVQRMISY